MRRGSSVAFALVPVLLLGPSATAVAPSSADNAEVTHVTDGDTAYLDPLDYGTTASSWPGRKARFIGVDTPEVYPPDGPECFGKKASRFTERKLSEADVKITYGKDPVDPYGRALVYIWLKGKLFNATLVRKGFARVEIYEPNTRYAKKLRRLQRAAKSADRGLWGKCD